MTRDAILSVIQRRLTAWNTHDVEAAGSLYAETGVVISPTGGVLEGRAEIGRINRLWFSAFPDVQFRADDVLVDGDRVVQVVQASGTHAGEFFGVPPSGRHIEVQMVTILTLADGLIVEERRIYDFTGFLVQVGVLKAKPTA
jgi:steroid delta-isomerase-like uncharacterized protein